MKKNILLISAAVILLFGSSSCSQFEENHEAKQLVRDYLSESLLDPNSFEEVEWNVVDLYSFKTNDEGKIEKDWDMIIEQSKKLKFNKLISLKFRANNSFGAKIINYKYALYIYDIEDPSIFIDDYLYSNKLGLNRSNENKTSIKQMFLWNYYFIINDGTKTREDFYKKYPEFKK